MQWFRLILLVHYVADWWPWFLVSQQFWSDRPDISCLCGVYIPVLRRVNLAGFWDTSAPVCPLNVESTVNKWCRNRSGHRGSGSLSGRVSTFWQPNPGWWLWRRQQSNVVIKSHDIILHVTNKEIFFCSWTGQRAAARRNGRWVFVLYDS